MAEMTLEERVARLEQRLDDLTEGKASKRRTPPKDWRRTVGMFRGDPIMKEDIEEALRLREEERRIAHEQEACERS